MNYNLNEEERRLIVYLLYQNKKYLSRQIDKATKAHATTERVRDQSKKLKVVKSLISRMERKRFRRERARRALDAQKEARLIQPGQIIEIIGDGLFRVEGAYYGNPTLVALNGSRRFDENVELADANIREGKWKILRFDVDEDSVQSNFASSADTGP